MVAETVLLGIGFFLLSLFVLAMSSLALVKATSHVAKILHMSVFMLGVLVLAITSALPDFLNTLISNLQGIADLGVGDVVGASIMDLCLTLGIVSLIVKSKMTKIENEVFAFSIYAVLLFIILGLDSKFSRLDGAIMFGSFIAYQVLMYKHGITTTYVHPPFKRLALSYIMIPLAIFSMIVGAFLLVSTSTYLAIAANVPFAIIGMFFAAFGASTPELISSIIAALKKKESLALGTMIGATIVNLLFAGGLVALLFPFSFTFSFFHVPLVILLISTIFFTGYVNWRGAADRPLGISLLAIYIVYLVLTYSFVR